MCTKEGIANLFVIPCASILLGIGKIRKSLLAELRESRKSRRVEEDGLFATG